MKALIDFFRYLASFFRTKSGVSATAVDRSTLRPPAGLRWWRVGSYKFLACDQARALERFKEFARRKGIMWGYHIRTGYTLTINQYNFHRKNLNSI
jgi:hypothetical protein